MEEKLNPNVHEIENVETLVKQLKEILTETFDDTNFQLKATYHTPYFDLEIEHSPETDSTCEKTKNTCCEEWGYDKKEEHIKTPKEMSLAENFICWALKNNVSFEDLDLTSVCKIVAQDPVISFIMDHEANNEFHGLRGAICDWVSAFLQSLYDVDFTKLREIKKN